MEELARFNTYLEMLDPMRGGYRCVMYDKALVDTFPKKSKTRIILDIDDGNIQVQAGIQSFGGGKYFSMIGKTKLGGHTYEQGQAISVVIYLDPNPLGWKYQKSWRYSSSKTRLSLEFGANSPTEESVPSAIPFTASKTSISK